MQGKKPGYIVIDEAANITPAMIRAFEEADTKMSPAEFRKQYTTEFEPEPGPPAILSLESGSPHFHPCFTRVGVRIDGEERNDIAYYNTKDMSYKTAKNTSHLATSIDPYWRYPASRQQRRAEERWAGKHK